MVSNAQLLSSELRYRRLFETAQDGILILDGHSGKIIDANPYLKNSLGYEKKDLLGKQLWQIGVFKDITGSKKAFAELKANGYIRYKDLPLQTKSGRPIDVEFISNVYMVGKREIIQCNIRDITSRKKIETAQEQTQKAMLNIMEDLEQAKAVIEVEKVKDEAILASIGDGLIAVDKDSKVVIVNKSAQKILGLKRANLMGKDINSLRFEDEEGRQPPLSRRPTSIALTTGRSVSGSYFFTRKDTTRLPLAINITPIKLDGKIIGALDILRDVTREKEIDRAKSEFVSLASHQLRTPLGIIKWYLEALEGENYFKNPPRQVRQYFDEIYKSNERVLSLVRDLLSVSRIDQGRVSNMPKPVDLGQAVTAIVRQMQIIADKKKVILNLSVKDKGIPLVNLDILRFYEAVENLVVNAIDYTEAGGRVDVLVNRSGKRPLISVTDTGIGISAADQKNLFTKFFRSEKAVGYNPEGSGLGLYVVKSYVEGWGGKISVRSEEGKGSTFTIIL